MFISQKTQQRQYKSKQPWFSPNERSYQVKNLKPCPTDCPHKEDKLIKMQIKGDIKTSNNISQQTKSYQGNVSLSDVPADINYKYQNNLKYKPNQIPQITGNGQKIQVWHKFDQDCPNYKPPQKQNKDDHHQTQNLNERSTQSHNQKRQIQGNNKQNDGAALALLALAAGGYWASYKLLEHSFQQQKHKYGFRQSNKAAGNIAVQIAGSFTGLIEGAVQGASIGAIAGPVGLFIGGGIGLLAGTGAGYLLKKIMPWNWSS